ncbi:hypothetical protein [Alicyclobacillus acidiphilus]|uniref:hypothetical protein n=1 Tax=Alicyclobacillus acidiphilus TaxID=182455 RepID=UPI00082E99EA|nr:hypothetical protein [Alicyclobacillus acidiphilus]
MERMWNPNQIPCVLRPFSPESNGRCVASLHAAVDVCYGIGNGTFFNVPIFATFLLGMFWKRATGWGGFSTLVSGIAFSFIF